MLRNSCMSLIPICCGMTALAQPEPIQADRPDQTECAFTVPAGFFQFESGFAYERDREDVETYTAPTVLWKYGINERIEARLITEITSVDDETGLLPITVGFKTKICEERGVLPTTAFIGHLTTSNAGSEDFQTPYAAPAFRFTMQHTLSPKFNLGYNLGAEWDGVSALPVYIYTLTTGYSIAGKLGAYIEVYGFTSEETKPDHRLDGGITYLLSDNTMADLSGGTGISGEAGGYYVSVGLSCRFNLKKKKTSD